jgi:hypothetical protein
MSVAGSGQQQCCTIARSMQSMCSTQTVLDRCVVLVAWTNELFLGRWGGGAGGQTGKTAWQESRQAVSWVGEHAVTMQK